MGASSLLSGHTEVSSISVPENDGKYMFHGELTKEGDLSSGCCLGHWNPHFSPYEGPEKDARMLVEHDSKMSPHRKGMTVPAFGCTGTKLVKPLTPMVDWHIAFENLKCFRKNIEKEKKLHKIICFKSFSHSEAPMDGTLWLDMDVQEARQGYWQWRTKLFWIDGRFYQMQQVDVGLTLFSETFHVPLDFEPCPHAKLRVTEPKVWVDRRMYTVQYKLHIMSETERQSCDIPAKWRHGKAGIFCSHMTICLICRTETALFLRSERDGKIRLQVISCRSLGSGKNSDTYKEGDEEGDAEWKSLFLDNPPVHLRRWFELSRTVCHAARDMGMMEGENDIYAKIEEGMKGFDHVNSIARRFIDGTYKVHIAFTDAKLKKAIRKTRRG